MKFAKILTAIVLADFLMLTGYVIYDVGYAGFFELAMANWATRLLMSDLVICLGLIGIWMFQDAREKGRSFAPYAALTLIFGSAGPLVYLLGRREEA